LNCPDESCQQPRQKQLQPHVVLGYTIEPLAD
jgi:hypothetical protein